ncbi:MAG: arginine decarboxylase, pyruvoyl-dependent, partial [Bacillota bacterium]|nr:arginine decarboxylase, pyruvoyl-dependent [Bacillota bacterium]
MYVTRPDIVKLAVGKGEGSTLLNAFDCALLEAGIGNLNLIRVSSILPPGCRLKEGFDVPAGSLAPTAYGYLMSDEPGERIAAAIGVGFSENDHGVIMEFSGRCTQEEAEARVRLMVEEAFAMRHKELKAVYVKAIDHV